MMMLKATDPKRSTPVMRRHDEQRGRSLARRHASVTHRPSRGVSRLVVAVTMLSMFWAVFTGCSNPDPITRYSVPKRKSTETSTAPTGDPSHRMMVGIAIHQSTAWFFKVLEPISKLNEFDTVFTSFLETVEFEDGGLGEPKFDIPENWSTQAASSTRFMTLMSEDGVEIAISSLIMQEELESYLRANVNRWRGQIGLPRVDADSPILDELGELQVEWGRMFLLDEIGWSGGGGGPPFAGGGGAPRDNNTADAPPRVTSGSRVAEYQTPEGWNQAQQTLMSKVSLAFTDDSGTVALTMTDLNARTNTWQANVVRWGNEVGHRSLTVDQVEAATEQISVGGIDSQMIRLPLVSDEDAEAPERVVVGVMTVHGDIAWFTKFAGSGATIDSQMEAFRTFLQSIEFGS